jgi:mono/diheme cytochrome c family protein
MMTLNRIRPVLTIAASALLLLCGGVIAASDTSGASANGTAPSGQDQSQSPWIELKGTSAPDPKHGKYIFQTKADCMGCHGWPGDGVTGKSPRLPAGANLRETQLDANTMIQIVSCGIPTTAMPYHDSDAYQDKRCYGETMADFKGQTPPQSGHFLSNQDIIDVVAYVQQKIKGRGPISKAECEAFFQPGAAACRYIK